MVHTCNAHEKRVKRALSLLHPKTSKAYKMAPIVWLLPVQWRVSLATLPATSHRVLASGAHSGGCLGLAQA